jgi:Sulfotransferase family
MSSDGERAPAPFIVGVMRSGTTLLRLMLDAHPQLTITPETKFLEDVVEATRSGDASAADAMAPMLASTRWADFHLDEDEFRQRLRTAEPLDPSKTLRALYEAYAERIGKPRWGDKTPGHAKRMPRIARALPEAHFVHLIRDGRDVTVSRRSRATDPAPVAKHAKRWQARIRSTRRRARRVNHYLEERYEELVRDPEPVLRRICEFIELDYDPAMLSYHEHAAERLQEIANPLGGKSGEWRLQAHALAAEPLQRERIGAWREAMSAEEIAEFESAAGDMLRELGYELSGAAR